MVLLPAAVGFLLFALRNRSKARLAAAVCYGLVQIVPAVCVFANGFSPFVFPLSGQGLELRFAADLYSRSFLLLVSLVFAPVSAYCAGWLRAKDYGGRFLLYLLLSLAMINGAMLSDNLAGMLFFWEGMLCTLFLSLMIGNTEHPHTAVKALVISGAADLLLMAGILVTASSAGTLTVSSLQKLPLTGTGRLGFALMFLGAAGKAGCMPFHSWIPDAASDGPLPFLVAFPGSLEKLLGIYLCARLVFQIYDVRPGGIDSILLMTLGTVTILLAVAMALIQKDMKRLMAWHAVSQVGYMILGIGTCLPAGLVGGMFHMINHVVYKSCLFMTAGSVEERTGTTDARQLGGLAKVMPVTAFSFTLSALAIAGVPPFSGFFSKELIFDAALESGTVFYLGALLGAILTAVSFLKLGRALFTGKTKMPERSGPAPKASPAMTVSMCLMAVLCLAMGLFNTIPTNGLFGPAAGLQQKFSGWPESALLVTLSLLALGLAVLDHIYGCRKTGAPITAADHIHNAPVLREIYALAEKGVFDPYRWLTGAMGGFSRLCAAAENGVSAFYDSVLAGGAKRTGDLLSRLDNGRLSRYIGMAFLGLALIALVLGLSLL